MSRKHKLADCDCIVDLNERYVSMCATHGAEHRGIHERWAADYRRNHPTLEESPVMVVTGS